METDTHIEVGDTPQEPSTAESLLEKLGKYADDARREELARQMRREKAAVEIAEYRWILATEHHLLEDGRSKLDFHDRPFLEAIYKDACLDRVIYGSSQFGKTELLICDVAANAMYGHKCMVVLSTHPKRERFASLRLEPCFECVPAYRGAISEAKDRGLQVGSVRQKGFGSGSIALVAASVAREFTSTPADAAWIDEHQECDQNNIAMIDDRFSGSWFRGLTRIGHPTTVGTEKNNNLDWLYQNSDRRVWEVPCKNCKRFQVLKWDQHIVHEKHNKHGAIVQLRPRDDEWRPGGKWDIRAVCKFCHQPMDRLSRMGRWHIANPGHERHGWRLSNLYNPNRTLTELYNRYSAARYKPVAMGEFVNKQLGEIWGMEGNKIEIKYLDNCSDGDSGIPPFKFRPVAGLAWRQPAKEGEEAW